MFASRSLYDRRVLVAAPPPAWIQRAPIPPPIVAWRLADVLGTPVVEGIAVDLDRTAGTLTVNVVDSRTNPPHIAKLREVTGTKVRWLRAGTRDGLRRSEIAIDVVDRGKETAYSSASAGRSSSRSCGLCTDRASARPFSRAERAAVAGGPPARS